MLIRTYTWVQKQDFATGATFRHRRPFDLLRGRGGGKNYQADGLPDVAQTASKAAQVMLLRDLLPSFIPHARIATYSYESDWRKAEVKTSLRKCGEQLLNVLHQNRSSEKVGEALDTHSSPLKISAGASTTFGDCWAYSWRIDNQTSQYFPNAEQLIPALNFS